MKLEDLQGKRVFDVDLELNGYELAKCRIAIDQVVIDNALSEEFIDCLYDLKDAEGVAGHLAKLIGIYNYRLSEIEGFYGLNSDLIFFLSYPKIHWSTKAREIDPNTLRWDGQNDF